VRGKIWDLLNFMNKKIMGVCKRVNMFLVPQVNFISI